MILALLSLLLLAVATSAQPYYDYTLQGTQKCALINVAMDESGSMFTEQVFLKDVALPGIVSTLQTPAYGFDHVFVCSNGFGNPPANPGVDPDGYRFIGCSDGLTLAILDWSRSFAGTHEDGYTALIKSIDRVPAAIDGVDLAQTCGSMAKNVILVSDEDRDHHTADAGVTQASVVNKIQDRQYVANLIVNVYIGDIDASNLGMRYNYDPAVQAALVPPTYPNEVFVAVKLANGTLDGNYDLVPYTLMDYTGYITNGQGNTVADYATLIENTPGAIWSIQTLRRGILLGQPELSQAFAKAFIDIKTCEIAMCRPPEAGGDPHITTWKNEHYEFHGQCDLVLAKDPDFGNGLGLDVHIRTKIVRYWSYIQSVAIRIGTDVLEIQGNSDSNLDPDYWINFEHLGDLDTFAGCPVTQTTSGPHKRSYQIDLRTKVPGHSLRIDLFREFVRVKLNGEKTAYHQTEGLLGDPITGKMLARDGVTEFADYVDFGIEWQVLPYEQKLFHEMAPPQFPELCLLPEDPRGERRRRLAESEISVEEARRACSALQDSLSIQDCVYDILATQDLDMVGAF
ncbi:unnamed protein product [Cylindrotheca closterium]|uniref:VWFD domain-containing protein n=1 Tax=Cylindrotheca closterium TaxID=2856 RepID=A0AAD2JJU2_9STRA|nr:unnamed protein product [Cylindrotheca closterium]